MAPKKAVVEVFVTAFNTLPSDEQRAFLARVLKMPKWRKDLIDIAIAESHSREKARPFREFLSAAEK